VLRFDCNKQRDPNLKCCHNRHHTQCHGYLYNSLLCAGAITAISCQNHIMFTSSLDKTIRLWTISTGNVIKIIKSPAIFDEPILCMSLNSNAIAIGGSGGSVQVNRKAGGFAFVVTYIRVQVCLPSGQSIASRQLDCRAITGESCCPAHLRL
jgi:hypothetical protein